jgi:glycosyltransferase involved in cell wall biosynthesis
MLFWLSALVAILTLALMAVFEIAVVRTGIARLLPVTSPAEPAPRLSVVIPARNEELDIETALRSVLSQQGVNLQVIVVNDNSTDSTGEIVERLAKEDSRITLVDDPPLKAGWLGKPNAMNHGVVLATSDLILFTDADIIDEATSFFTGVSILKDEGLDFLSFTPMYVCESFWENVFLPLSLYPNAVKHFYTEKTGVSRSGSI